jgi:MFS family permease
MFWVLIISAVAGNFFAAFLVRKIRYRWAISSLCMMYFLSMFFTYLEPLGHSVLYVGFVAMGISQGVFAIFTMYLPPLFPTLLRTTGAGFCYNIGRIVAGLGTVFFGLFSSVGEHGGHRLAMFYASFLFIPAAIIALLLPEPPDENLPRQVDQTDGILLE